MKTRKYKATKFPRYFKKIGFETVVLIPAGRLNGVSHFDSGNTGFSWHLKELIGSPYFYRISKTAAKKIVPHLFV